MRQSCKNGHDTSSASARRRDGVCKACRVEQVRRYRAKHPERVRERGRRTRAKNPEKYRVMELCCRYGLDPAELRELRSRTACAACKQPFVAGAGGLLSRNIDHCHATGRVRGVLHQRCNVALGMFHEDPALIRALAAYAERVAA